MMWSPYPKFGNDWDMIPPEPMCYMYGEFVPTPRVDNGGFKDRVMANCCMLTKGVMGLFQEDPDNAVVVVQDNEYKVPWDMPFILAEYPEDVEDKAEKEG
jgi:hypothetical protein